MEIYLDHTTGITQCFSELLNTYAQLIEVSIGVVKDFVNSIVTFACISLMFRLYHKLDSDSVEYRRDDGKSGPVTSLVLSFLRSLSSFYHLFHFLSVCESMSV